MSRSCGDVGSDPSGREGLRGDETRGVIHAEGRTRTTATELLGLSEGSLPRGRRSIGVEMESWFGVR